MNQSPIILSFGISSQCFPEHWHDSPNHQSPYCAHAQFAVNGTVRHVTWSIEYLPDYLHLVPDFDASELGIGRADGAALRGQAERMVDEAWDDYELRDWDGDDDDDGPVTLTRPALFSFNSSAD
jgi:hypothetical protein